MKEKLRVAALCLCGVMAVVWPSKVVFDLMNHIPDTLGRIVLDILCGDLWIVAFLLNLRNYIVHKKEEQ